MAGLRVSLALGLGALGAAGRPADCSALVQLSRSLRLPGSLLFPPTSARRRSAPFPLVSDKFGFPAHFVGSAEFNVDVLSFSVHAYTIAMYLDASSELWIHGPEKVPQKRQVEMMRGAAFFEMVARSRYMKNKDLAQFADRLEYFAELEHLSDYNESLARYRSALLRAPAVTAGSRVDLFPSADGIAATIAGESIGTINGTSLGHLLLTAYLGPDSDLPGFRDNVFAQLAQGKPERIGMPAEIRTRLLCEVWTVIVFVGLGLLVAAVIGFIGGLWCRRRQARAELGGTSCDLLSSICA
mmetsp:Transcript_41458/g.111964  ORF Transcript_41458/g.111964 Transcript_41458/m.111964 type:complete len:298 (-) Transcript_41458:201-1094(-)